MTSKDYMTTFRLSLVYWFYKTKRASFPLVHSSNRCLITSFSHSPSKARSLFAVKTNEPMRMCVGARVYHLRAVLHDWPTTDCKTTLSHVVAAMEPDYPTLILREFILPDINAPLLGCCNDLLIMIPLAGMERTEGQWEELLDDVGLQIVGIWSIGNSGESVIEAVRKT